MHAISNGRPPVIRQADQSVIEFEAAQNSNLTGIGLDHLTKRQTIRTGESGPVLQHVLGNCPVPTVWRRYNGG
jgi:hypothetical protein